MANTFFPKLTFTIFFNRNVKIVLSKFEGNSLARRRYQSSRFQTAGQGKQSSVNEIGTSIICSSFDACFIT